MADAAVQPIRRAAGFSRWLVKPLQHLVCGIAGFSMLVKLRRVASDMTEVVIDAEVDLHLAGSDNYSLSARLNVGLLGVGRDVAEQLVKDAEQLCPYSKATRGNIDVAINVV